MFSCKHVVVLVRRLVGNVIKICICDKFGIIVDNNVRMLVGTNICKLVGMIFGYVVQNVVIDQVCTVLGINEGGVLVGDSIGTFVDIDVGMLGCRNAR